MFIKAFNKFDTTGMALILFDKLIKKRLGVMSIRMTDTEVRNYFDDADSDKNDKIDCDGMCIS